MAEVVAVVSALVSVAQLADYVCQASKNIHAFFWAINDASRDVQRLCLALEELNGLAYNICLFEREHSSSRGAVIEHEVLPQAITSLSGCKEELETLRHSIDLATSQPSGSTRRMRLGRRIRWVMKEKELSTLLGRLEKHKSTLNLYFCCLNA
jgi:hypothetical protein